jgi:phosphoglycolate phosphatase
MENKGIIFDLDGTLWEVIDATLNSVNIITKEKNLKEVDRDTVCRAFGLNEIEVAKLYFPYLEDEEAINTLREIAKIKVEYLRNNGGYLYPKLEEILDKLKEKYNLYIVSNTAEIEYIEAFLKTSNTYEFFKDYIAASSLNISKTDAIKKIIEDNKIESAVYIGDTIIDLESAKNNKIPFVYAKYGFGKNLNTKYSISDIKELPNVLEKIFNE